MTNRHAGRHINHDIKGNLCVKIIEIDKIPRLVFFAKRQINKNEEITYDYADRNKDTLLHFPWIGKSKNSKETILKDKEGTNKCRKNGRKIKQDILNTSTDISGTSIASSCLNKTVPRIILEDVLSKPGKNLETTGFLNKTAPRNILEDISSQIIENIEPRTGLSESNTIRNDEIQSTKILEKENVIENNSPDQIIKQINKEMYHTTQHSIKTDKSTKVVDVCSEEADAHLVIRPNNEIPHALALCTSILNDFCNNNESDIEQNVSTNTTEYEKKIDKIQNDFLLQDKFLPSANLTEINKIDENKIESETSVPQELVSSLIVSSDMKFSESLNNSVYDNLPSLENLEDILSNVCSSSLLVENENEHNLPLDVQKEAISNASPDNNIKHLNITINISPPKATLEEKTHSEIIPQITLQDNDVCNNLKSHSGDLSDNLKEMETQLEIDKMKNLPFIVSDVILKPKFRVINKNIEPHSFQQSSEDKPSEKVTSNDALELISSEQLDSEKSITNKNIPKTEDRICNKLSKIKKEKNIEQIAPYLQIVETSKPSKSKLLHDVPEIFESSKKKESISFPKKIEKDDISSKKKFRHKVEKSSTFQIISENVNISEQPISSDQSSDDMRSDEVTNNDTLELISSDQLDLEKLISNKNILKTKRKICNKLSEIKREKNTGQIAPHLQIVETSKPSTSKVTSMPEILPSTNKKDSINLNKRIKKDDLIKKKKFRHKFQKSSFRQENKKISINNDDNGTALNVEKLQGESGSVNDNSMRHGGKKLRKCREVKYQLDDMDSDESVTSKSSYHPSSADDESEYEDDKSDDSHSTEINTIDFSEGKAGINDENLFVDCVKIIKNKDDVITKQHFCLYCKQLKTKLNRHLISVHKNEEKVLAAVSHGPKSPTRAELIKKIQTDGDFIYNTKAEYNTGKLIVARRPSTTSTMGTHYTACITCLQFFSKSNIRHHIARCKKSDKIKSRDNRIQSRKLECRVHPLASLRVRNDILPIMRDDDVYRIIRYDNLIITYANKLVRKHKDEFQHNYIRSKLRYLGKILLNAKQKMPEITDMASLYHPKYYGLVTDVCNELAGYDQRNGEYKSPAIATNLGTLIKAVGRTNRVRCIKEGLYSKKKFTEEFLEVFAEEYALDVNKIANEQRFQQRRQKNIVLPSLSDIQKLWIFLNENRKRTYDKLKENFDISTWEEHMGYTLISIQVFNRRRPGETERLHIADFEARKSIDKDVDPEVYERLTQKEKEYAEKYVRFEVRGKKNNMNVPIILQKSLEDSVLLILKQREDAEVPHSNPYVFGLPCSDPNRPKFVRAYTLLRKYSEMCGAEIPNSLRGTKLRKHIATACLKLNLDDQVVSDLAEYMGHSDNIHKQVYRLPVAHKQILNVAQLLKIAQGQNESSDDEELDNLNHTEENETISENDSSSHAQGFLPKKKKRKLWSYEESSLLETSFEEHIKKRKLPSYQQIRSVKEKYPSVLENRTEAQIKSWVSNKYKKIDKIACKETIKNKREQKKEKIINKYLKN